MHVCPHCASNLTRRSRRRSFQERVIGLVVLPFRCQRCDYRFFRFRWQRVMDERPASGESQTT